MAYIHREGQYWVSAVLIAVVVALLAYIQFPGWLTACGLVASTTTALLVTNFFRNPVRKIALENDNLVYAPADGKVVVIEHVLETEYFKDHRLQISVFMNPLNVHVNRFPVGGQVVYCQHHPGAYLVAWHPKSSLLNERTSVVVRTAGGHEILIRQIAGALANRIRCYATTGLTVKQGGELGFIKFGSRVDVFLPLNAEVTTAVGRKVAGNVDVIAKLMA